MAEVDGALPDRAGLSSDLAYLRWDYPSPSWATHANYGQLAAFWLGIHGQLRSEGADVARTVVAFREGRSDRIGFQGTFAATLNRFLGHLDAHHGIEDTVYFPKFRLLDRRMEAGFELLDGDHRLIHTTLGEVVERARMLLTALGQGRDAIGFALDGYAVAGDRLTGLLDRHLADEEELVIPAILHFGERAVT